MLAISTAWNAKRFKQAKQIIGQLRELGFNTFELSFHLTKKSVDQIEQFVEKKEIKVISLHNYCPIPKGFTPIKALPDSFSISSTNEDERLRALKQTKISIDTAQRLDATCLIMHCGRVEIKCRTKPLIQVYKEYSKDSREFKRIKKKAKEERAKKIKKHLSQALKSLDTLASYAKKRRVLLGIENRIYHREIPSFKEIGLILDNFRGSCLRYWHDTGHAQINHNLGFCKHLDYLKKYKDQLIGMHLHDILNMKDHIAPSKGSFDFRILKPFLKKDTIKVIEAHAPATANDLIDARIYLEKIFN